MNPFPSSIKKTTALGAILLALILPACTGSWLADPLSRYVQQKTGLDIHIKEVHWDLWSLGVELKKITLGVNQKSAKGRVIIPDLHLRLGWEFSAAFPFVPRLGVEHLIFDSPQVSLQGFKTEETADWRAWLKKLPAIRKWEIRNLSGRVEQEGTVIQISAGADFSGAFQPDQSNRVRLRCPGIEGRFVTSSRSFKGKVEGEMEISHESEPFLWKGNLVFSGAYRESDRVRVEGLAGSLQMEGSPAALEIKEGDIHFSRVEAISGSYLFKGEGPATVRGALRLVFSDHQTRLLPQLTVGGEGIHYILKKDARQLFGQARGQVRIEGSGDRPALQGLLEISRTSLELDDIKIAGLEARLEFKGEGARVAFPRVTARAETFLWDREGSPLLLRDPETEFRALFVPGENRWRLKEILLRSEPWGALQGALVFDPALGAASGGSVRFSQFPLIRLINLLTSAPVQKEMESWPITGTLSWGREKKEAPLAVRVALEASGLKGAEAGDRSWTVQSLDTRVAARFDWDLSGREITGFWKQEFLTGSLAFNGRVFSFSETPLPLEFNGKISYPPGGFRVRGSWKFKQRPLGVWTGSGELDWRSPTLRYQGQVQGTGIPLQESIPLLAGKAGGMGSPWLRTMEPRGVISAEFSLNGSNREYGIQGRVRGSDLDFELRDPGIHFQISQLDLPVRWGSSLSPGPMDPDLPEGRVQIRDIRTPWSSIPFLEIPVSADFKGYRILEPLTVPLWGGVGTARGIIIDGSDDRPSLRAEVNLKELDLSAILPDRGIEGKLAGDLGTVSLNAARASASGALTAQVFEGTVTARDLNLVLPFSVERRFQGNVLLDHINLEPLTRVFSFGKISGFVQGTIEHLSIGRGYPERFHLTLKTQEVAGVPKKINVQAIENVSLLGTGWGELGGLRSGINRWFQEYPYREIGLTCTLAEGRVSLRGTIYEEDLEFLVRKPGLIGIDVINRNPENEIDFSDMLERIRRMQKSNDQGGKNDAQ